MRNGCLMAHGVQICKVARDIGLSVDTIRFYEKEGLLREPPRSQVGFHHLPAAARVRAVLRQEGVSAEVLEIEVKDESTAKALAFPGSPTIRINGLDIESAVRGSVDIGCTCRRYRGGLPSEEMIRAAVWEVRAA
jgi:hypothetical protein